MMMRRKRTQSTFTLLIPKEALAAEAKSTHTESVYKEFYASLLQPFLWKIRALASVQGKLGLFLFVYDF